MVLSVSLPCPVGRPVLCDWRILLRCEDMQSWDRVSKLQYIEKNCGLKLGGLTADVFLRCLKNSPLASHFQLNLESYISCYLLVFPWHPIMPSPQCSAMFQIHGAVNERGRIYCPPSFRRKKVKGKKCQCSLACQAFSH